MSARSNTIAVHDDLGIAVDNDDGPGIAVRWWPFGRQHRDLTRVVARAAPPPESIAPAPHSAPGPPAPPAPDRTGDAAGQDPAASSLRWLRLALSVLGPVTIATALLYYYGYVTTYAEFDYFGVDVDLLHYSTADFVLRSSASLFVPVLALLLLAGLGYWLHTGLSTWGYFLDRPRAARITGGVAAIVGGLLLARGLFGVVDGDVSANEAIGVSPGSLGAGTLLLLYGLRLRRQHLPQEAHTSPNQSRQIVAWTIGWCLVILSLFWLVNSFAHAYGIGTARYIEKGLVQRPEVIVHYRSRLWPEDRGVDLNVLCETTIGSKDYPYRYINLRLLVATDKELFLVPVTWTKDSGVVIVLKKDEALLQFMHWPEEYVCPEHHEASG